MTFYRAQFGFVYLLLFLMFVLAAFAVYRVTTERVVNKPVLSKIENSMNVAQVDARLGQPRYKDRTDIIPGGLCNYFSNAQNTWVIYRCVRAK